MEMNREKKDHQQLSYYQSDLMRELTVESLREESKLLSFLGIKTCNLNVHRRNVNVAFVIESSKKLKEATYIHIYIA